MSHPASGRLRGCESVLAFLFVMVAAPSVRAADSSLETLDVQIPNTRNVLSFGDEKPIYFLTRSQNVQEWDKLTRFWNEGAEKVVDPNTGLGVTRKKVTIKVPLGLSQAPPAPVENPMTVAKWA